MFIVCWVMLPNKCTYILALVLCVMLNVWQILVFCMTLRHTAPWWVCSCSWYQSCSSFSYAFVALKWLVNILCSSLFFCCTPFWLLGHDNDDDENDATSSVVILQLHLFFFCCCLMKYRAIRCCCCCCHCCGCSCCFFYWWYL